VNNPFDYFDHIFCINLDERKDRWEDSLKEFDKVGIKDRVERFSAIKDKSGRNGCGMSHIEVIKLCKKNNYKRPLILEDDVMFLDNPMDNLKKSLDEFKQYENWSMFYLGGTLGHKVWEKLDNLIVTDFIATTSSYMLNPTMYDFIIEDASKYYYDNWVTADKWAVDDYYVCKIQRDYAKENDVYTFATNPLIALQRGGYSDILNHTTNYSEMQLRRWNRYVNE
tara:strand:- start:146 stop:817 length:672 start_codon:yes stop_codon:yes gene_type:complete